MGEGEGVEDCSGAVHCNAYAQGAGEVGEEVANEVGQKQLGKWVGEVARHIQPSAVISIRTNAA